MGEFLSFLKDESGATAIEYGLLAALIAVAIVATASTVGTRLNNAFQSVSNQLPTAAVAKQY